MAGSDTHGADWVGCAGYYLGLYGPVLDIPPTGHLAHMRYHEYYRFDEDRIVEIQAVWDLPGCLIQAGVMASGTVSGT